MKLDRHGIRSRIFLMYVLFAIGIVALLGVLQLSLIRPYYRQNRTETMITIADQIESKLLKSTGSSEEALRLIVDNNACAVLLNEQGYRIYEADGLGSSCVFNIASSSLENAPVSFRNGVELIQYLKDESGEVGINLNNARTGQEMVVYGRVIKETLGNYYLFVTSPTEPVDSIINFFSRQYVTYTFIVVFIAILFSFILSTGISRPIIDMKKEADKLAVADYSASFNGGSFTETKELAVTLNGATKQLSQIDELRKDLIANVSHDIKTPLTSIRAYAEMIRDVSGDMEEKRNEHLNVIINEADYLNQLVTDMNELSKVQSGTYIPRYENFDFTELIEQVIKQYEPMIHEHELLLETDVEEQMVAYADRTKIAQVIANFVTNAIKHTPSNHHIYIRAKHLNEDCIRFEIQDEGEGISEESLPTIWDRYQKASKSFSRSMTSTGLGLSIVKAILDVHHARYGVSSEVGKGSLFWFELDRPLDMEEADHEL